MSAAIRAMYRDKGLTPPDGKGIHTERAHQCVVNYMKKGMPKDEAWKRCMGGLGRNLAVKKSHWKENVARNEAIKKIKQKAG